MTADHQIMTAKQRFVMGGMAFLGVIVLLAITVRLSGEGLTSAGALVGTMCAVLVMVGLWAAIPGSGGVLVAPTVAGIFSGFAAGVVLIVVTPLIADFSSNFVPPSCENPTALRRLDLTEMLKHDRILLTASEMEPPPAPPRGGVPIWDVRNLVDGRSETVWTPAKAVPRPRFRIEFPGATEDVELVCAVNGAATTEEAYLRADRVRTLRTTRVDAGDGRHTRVSPMRTLDPYTMQNRQSVQFDAGTTHAIDFEVVDRYEGRPVWNPTKNGWEERTDLLAFAEVELYVAD